MNARSRHMLCFDEALMRPFCPIADVVRGNATTIVTARAGTPTNGTNQGVAALS